MGVYENLLPGKENALTPEYLTVQVHGSLSLQSLNPWQGRRAVWRV